MIVRGLTLIRPWPWAIAYGPKRIENRTWKPHDGDVREGLWLAIHAGKSVDQDAYEWIRTLWPSATTYAAKAWEEGIVAVARVARVVTVTALKPRDPWAFGPYCWELDQVRALPCVIHAKGSLNLWELKPAALAAVLPLCSAPAGEPVR